MIVAAPRPLPTLGSPRPVTVRAVTARRSNSDPEKAVFEPGRGSDRSRVRLGLAGGRWRLTSGGSRVWLGLQWIDLLPFAPPRNRGQAAYSSSGTDFETKRLFATICALGLMGIMLRAGLRRPAPTPRAAPAQGHVAEADRPSGLDGAHVGGRSVRDIELAQHPFASQGSRSSG